MKIKKNIFFGGGGVRGGVGLGGQGGCERRIEVFVKIQKKKNWEGGFGWGGGSEEGVGLEGGGVRVDVIDELKFLETFKKKLGKGGWVGRGGGSDWWGGGGGGGGSGWM